MSIDTMKSRMGNVFITCTLWASKKSAAVSSSTERSMVCFGHLLEKSDIKVSSLSDRNLSSNSVENPPSVWEERTCRPLQDIQHVPLPSAQPPLLMVGLLTLSSNVLYDAISYTSVCSLRKTHNPAFQQRH